MIISKGGLLNEAEKLDKLSKCTTKFSAAKQNQNEFTTNLTKGRAIEQQRVIEHNM